MKHTTFNTTTEKLRDKTTYKQHNKTHNRNTGYPAHEPPRINIWYLFAVGSWAGYPVFLLLCFLFSKPFWLFLCFVCFRLVDLSFCIYNRKTHINTYINITKTRQTHKHKQNKHKYMISQPEPERYLFAVRFWAGYPGFLLLCCSRSFSVVCLFLLFMFSPSLFKLLHLQSNKHIQKHNNTTYITTGVPFIKYFPFGCSRLHEDTCLIFVS